jgi:hypothetical protein
MINTKAEITEWIAEARTVESAELPMPATLIRALMAQSVIDNWPRYEIAEDGDGQPVALRFGSPAAANKALEMLAKDAGLLISARLRTLAVNGPHRCKVTRGVLIWFWPGMVKRSWLN